jgi:VIT family
MKRVASTGVPEAEARKLAAHLVAQPEAALKTLASEELGPSGQTFPNPRLAALSTAFGAFIPIVPFFFTAGYPAVIISFVISTIAHFLIGSVKPVVTGPSPWRSGLEMMIVGLREALITDSIGLLFGPVLKRPRSPIVRIDWAVGNGIGAGSQVRFQHRPVSAVVPAQGQFGVAGLGHGERPVKGRMTVAKTNQLE